MEVGRLLPHNHVGWWVVGLGWLSLVELLRRGNRLNICTLGALDVPGLVDRQLLLPLSFVNSTSILNKLF